ncbi:MAG: hypothetical protein HKN16_03575 [Saprospiraceae bacterium]|nr:hypothetical protein [Saprospiraceae bacterium]
MLTINDLKVGEMAIVMELPIGLPSKQTLLVHGIHLGGKITMIQSYPSQGLSLISHHGRRIALRYGDCNLVKVTRVDE